jgi:hypothetical protein
MIQFNEIAQRDGYMTVVLQADGMPVSRDSRDFRYVITVRPDGACESRSRAFGAGSTRHYSFPTYDAAQAHAVAWAKRKIAGR